MLAQGWLVLLVTDSAFWVGGVAGLRGAGQVAFGLMAGVIVDRFNRRLIITIAQTIRAATFIMARGASVYGQHPTVAHTPSGADSGYAYGHGSPGQ